ncbi:hypothetical protein IAT38_002207 [Cryptococcus sp. DSM 104549]
MLPPDDMFTLHEGAMDGMGTVNFYEYGAPIAESPEQIHTSSGFNTPNGLPPLAASRAGGPIRTSAGESAGMPARGTTSPHTARRQSRADFHARSSSSKAGDYSTTAAHASAAVKKFTAFTEDSRRYFNLTDAEKRALCRVQYPQLSTATVAGAHHPRSFVIFSKLLRENADTPNVNQLVDGLTLLSLPNAGTAPGLEADAKRTRNLLSQLRISRNGFPVQSHLSQDRATNTLTALERYDPGLVPAVRRGKELVEEALAHRDAYSAASTIIATGLLLKPLDDPSAPRPPAWSLFSAADPSRERALDSTVQVIVDIHHAVPKTYTRQTREDVGTVMEEAEEASSKISDSRSLRAAAYSITRWVNTHPGSEDR